MNSSTATATPSAAIGLHTVQDLERRFPRQKVELPNGETLSYVDCPLGTTNTHTLLVLPGYGCDSKYMAYTLAQYAAFQDHRVIAVDPRGYGESTMHTGSWLHEENAEDIKIFMDKIGLTKAIMVMGYSTGAGTAAWLGLKYPERFQAVWMVAGIPLDGLRMPMMNDQGKPTENLLKTRDDAREFAKTVMAPNHSPDMEVFRNDQGAICIQGNKSLPPADDALFQIYHQAALSHRARAQALYANAAFNITPIQTPVTPPTQVLANRSTSSPVMIVVHGSVDYFVKVQHVRAVTELAIVERWAPKGSLCYYDIPSCGHMFMYDNPTGFQEVYLRALNERIIHTKPKMRASL